jgi:hypothetical protein
MRSRRAICRSTGISEQWQSVVSSLYPGNVTVIRDGQASVKLYENKLESRSPKFEAISNGQKSDSFRQVRCEFSSLGFVLDFDIRILMHWCLVR